MKKEEIEQLRIDIESDYESRIEKLKEEMTAELQALSRIEARLSNFNTIVNTDPKSFPKFTAKPFILTSSNKQHQDRPIKIKEIIVSTLNKMEGEFSRQALYLQASADLGVNIKTGSFAPVFSDLIKAGKIIVVKNSSGSTAGTYKKGGEEQ